MKEYKIYTKNEKTGLTETFILSAIDIVMLSDLLKIVQNGLHQNVKIVKFEQL